VDDLLGRQPSRQIRQVHHLAVHQRGDPQEPDAIDLRACSTGSARRTRTFTSTRDPSRLRIDMRRSAPYHADIAQLVRC
jgi:hypothetical protein